MNKLPEVLIQEILSFLYKPSDCFNKKLEQFAYIDPLTYNLSKKLRNKCVVEYIDNKKICKTHCKAYPIHKKLELEFIENRYIYIHFENRYMARFAWNLYRAKFIYYCCKGKGLRIRIKRKLENGEEYEHKKSKII